MDRWYWVELIGFDNTSPDFGVAAYLSRNRSTTGVSLLFAHIDFLFAQENEALAPTACSYGGHEYNRERRRQNWTKTQLKGLVKELHAHGVKVFFSCFDMTDTITDPAWLCYGRKGKPQRLVYVLKRLENGTVGDVVIGKICAVLDEYGFDGLQLGDGLSSNRLSIENGDFSVPFCRQSGISIPQKLWGEDPESYVARREWILKNKRVAWTSFLADAWADFYKKLFDAVIGCGYKFPQQFDPFTGKIGFDDDKPFEDGYGPTVLSVLEYIAHIWGVTMVRGQIWFSMGTGDPYTYEQGWGGHRYRIESDGKTAAVFVDGCEKFRTACGKRVITDKEGNVLEEREIE